MENELNLFARRAGFNTALRHFKTVNGIVGDIEEGWNLADVVNESLEDGGIQRFQVRSILSALLVEKFGYHFQSHNLKSNVEDIDAVCQTLKEWQNIHIVLTFFNPQAGMFVINPKQKESWGPALPLLRHELIVVYTGAVDLSLKKDSLAAASADFLTLLYGGKVRGRKEYREGSRRPVEAPQGRAPQSAPVAQTPSGPTPTPVKPKPASEGGPRRITPRYAVNVTNELFHNGNVESWKRVIESYRTKYPDLDVLIWYENERINDINALFKWGKVKHGTPIMFSVAGGNIRDVSKLQRYLFEGASPRFEVFLRGGVGRVLDLF